MKRLFGILLTCLLLITALPLSALAAVTPAEGTCGEGLTWKLNAQGTLTISGTGAIPNEFNWYDQGLDMSLVSRLVLEEGITAIGDWSMAHFTEITSLTIPDSVAAIGHGGFRGCTNLTTINIGKGLTTIGLNAFEECEFLNAFMVDAANTAFSSKDGVLFNKDKTTLLQYPLAKTTSSYTVPDGVTAIALNAFAHNLYLEKAILSDSVKTINANGFAYAQSLSEITFSKNLKTIYGDAFNSCRQLVSVELPDSVTDLWPNAFANCENLTDLTLSAGLTSIPQAAFEFCGITSLIIPDGVTVINSSAFNGCNNLSAISFPAGLTTIGIGAFSNIEALKSVDLPASLTSMKDGAFMNTGLLSVTIPGSLKVLPPMAFDYCWELESIYLEEGVTTLGRRAFGNCWSLTEVTMPATLSSIDQNAFRTTEPLHPLMPDFTVYGTANTFAEQFARTNARTFVDLDTGNTVYRGECGGENATLTWELSDTTLTVTGQGAMADKIDWQGQENTVESVVIKKGTTSIGTVFSGCTNLTAITLPSSVETIASDAFAGCENLTIYGHVGSAAEVFATTHAIPFVPLPDAIPGEVDATEGVSASDALLALQAATGKVTLDDTQTSAADVDGNGTVTASDALLILQYATKKIHAF